jgi:integrase
MLQPLKAEARRMTNVRGSELRTKRRTVITEEEFDDLCYQADLIHDEFMRLRAKALLCLLRLTGKRRGEVNTLKLDSFKIEKGFLNVTFILEKKRKESILQKQAVKSIPLSDPFTKPILAYLDYLKKHDSKPEYFLPRVKSVFGNNAIVPDAHISGRQVFNVIRGLSETVWPHLFRETVASDIIRQDNSIISAFKVMQRLDLEDYATGFNYIRRYARDVIQREEQKLKQHTRT